MGLESINTSDYLYKKIESLKMGENGVNARHSDARTRFLLNIGDLIMVDNDAISGSTLAKSSSSEINRQTNSFRKGSIAIRSKD